MTINTVLALVNNHQLDEARSRAMEMAAGGNLSPEDEKQLGILLLTSGDEKQSQAGCLLLANHVEAPEIPNHMRVKLAEVSWNSGHADIAVKASRFALRGDPNLAHLYRILGMGLICEHDYEKAMFVLIAGIGITRDVNLHESWIRVARALWQGAKNVSFVYNGHKYNFGLDIFGPMTVEAANYHLNGKFTEQDELQRLAKEIKHGASIVEMGTLVGNHSLFFMGETGPASMLLIDGNQQALDVTKANLEHNFGTALCPVEYVHRFVGRDSRKCMFQGCEVQQDNLDAILDGKSYDFIKIDADGSELDLLDGAMKTITANKPAMMLEVEKANRVPAEARLAPLGYKVIWSVDHGGYENLFLRVG